MTADDYRSALEADAPAKELKGRSRETPWDPQLAHEMLKRQLMVEEEAVVAVLLDDLRSS
jgi:hypothetical protein